MRRKDKAMRDAADIRSVLEKARVCRLGMVDGDKPYVVPLCFGYDGDTLYFHGALKGRKIDILQKNPNVCFEFDAIAETITAEDPCGWSMQYRSVVGFGQAALVEDPAGKREALKIIMAQYTEGAFTFPANKVDATIVIRVTIDSMTGKQSGYE